MLFAAIGLTVLSALAVNWGYVREHAAAASLPPLSARRPRESLRALLGARAWLTGFATETAGFLCFVGALALAPLALVQSLAAGGIAILALLTARFSRRRLEPRERLGAALAVAGLVLLGISLAGGSSEGSAGRWAAIALWLVLSAAAAGAALRLAGGRGVGYGLAAGVLFAAGDVTTKTVVTGGARLAFLPALFAAYGLGTSLLQLGFQKGGALATAGTATLLTDALPILAGTTLYAEPFPAGALGPLRGVAFAALVVAAVAFARADAMLKPGCPNAAVSSTASSAMSRRKKRATVQSATTRSFRDVSAAGRGGTSG
jgi:hypothetical protein